MTIDERDEAVAAALRGIAVPDHAPGFWDELDAGLRDDPFVPAADGAGTRTLTGELPAVAPLVPDRPSRRAPLLVAAAVLVLLGAVGFVAMAGDGGDDPAEVADQPRDTDGSEAADAPAPAAEDTAQISLPAESPTTTASFDVTAAATGTPEAITASWLDALGQGEVAAAAELTGPRSVAYIESLGPDVTVESFLTESQEGFGAWPDAEDLEVRLTSIGPLDFDGGTLQVVVVSGTYPGDGGGFRIDVFPLVDDGEGFKVEHLAFDPDRDNDPVFTLPAETETGLRSIGPSDEINVFVPAHGTVYCELDAGPPLVDETSVVAGDAFALCAPPEDLTPGEHVLVLVAVADDGTLAHFGGPLTVVA